MIYLDYAATSWPKPPGVLEAMTDYLTVTSGSPARSAHSLSVAAGRTVQAVREDVADLFGVADPLRVIFTSGATQAINLGLHGLLEAGDQVVVSGVEHNAVMRPIRSLEQHGVGVVVARATPDGRTEPAAVAAAIEQASGAGHVRLVVANHASNVCGAIAPVGLLAALAHRAGALLLVDAAQTAGVLAIDMVADGIDLLAFTGHKGLHGPPGTGGLVLGDQVNHLDIDPLIRGGTGSRSDSEEQPGFLPDRFESGTPNGPGIAGLGAGIQWVRQRGLDAVRSHERRLHGLLLAGLGGIPGVTVHGGIAPEDAVAVVSFTVAGRTVSDVGFRLDRDHGILCRVGLHCAPAAHRALGTYPQGTLRFAPGPQTTDDDIAHALRAVAAVAAG